MQCEPYVSRQQQMLAAAPCPPPSGWYPGQVFPGDPDREGGVQYTVRQRETKLMAEDTAATGSITLYKSFAEEDNAQDPFLGDSSLVTEVNVPAGQTGVYVRARATISDPSQADTVYFAFYMGTTRIVNIWDGSLNQVIEPHITGGLASGGGKGTSFSLRAIIAPDRWSTASGPAAKPLRSQMKANGVIELWTVSKQGVVDGRDCP